MKVWINTINCLIFRRQQDSIPPKVLEVGEIGDVIVSANLIAATLQSFDKEHCLCHYCGVFWRTWLWKYLLCETKKYLGLVQRQIDLENWWQIDKVQFSVAREQHLLKFSSRKSFYFQIRSETFGRFYGMGQLVTRPTGRGVKTDTNPNYQTYGNDNDVDYIQDFNGQYQPSDYDEMYEETSSRGSTLPGTGPKVITFT